MELDLGSLSLSFGSAWIAESKVQLISFMATCVGVMLFTFCTQKTICQDGYSVYMVLLLVYGVVLIKLFLYCNKCCFENFQVPIYVSVLLYSFLYTNNAP